MHLQVKGFEGEEREEEGWVERGEKKEGGWGRWKEEGREVEVGRGRGSNACERGNELTIAPHEMFVVRMCVCVRLCVSLLFRSVSFSFVQFGSVSFIYSRHLRGVVVPTVRLTNRFINLWFHKRNLNCISRAGRAKQSSDCERCSKQQEEREAETVGREMTLTCADEETIAQPGLEELVLGCLVDVDMAAQQQLHVPRIIDEDHQLGADPHFGDVLKGRALPDDCFENSCKREREWKRDRGSLKSLSGAERTYRKPVQSHQTDAPQWADRGGRADVPPACRDGRGRDASRCTRAPGWAAAADRRRCWTSPGWGLSSAPPLQQQQCTRLRDHNNNSKKKAQHARDREGESWLGGDWEVAKLSSSFS